MNEHNSNKNGAQNAEQPFDYQAHYRRQNQQYHSNQPDNSQPYQNPSHSNNSQYYQNTQNQPPVPPAPPQRPPITQNYACSDNTKLFSVLSYISILWIVGLLADKNNLNVRFHVNQGIILTIFGVVLNIFILMIKSFISVVLMEPFSNILLISKFGMMLNGMFSFISCFFYIVFMIIGIMHAVQNKQEPLPVIGTLFQILK